jgi:hypothetical protein
MLALEVSINGKRQYLAGHSDEHSLSPRCLGDHPVRAFSECQYA